MLNLGHEARGLTKRQRRAIALRDGGTCAIRGCQVAAPWGEIHHDTGPWHLKMRYGAPEIRYTHGHTTRDWHPAGDGTASRITAQAPPGAPPGQ